MDCPHYLTLRNQVDDGLLHDPGQPFGSFARLLADKGLAHENDCLADYRRQSKSIFEVPAREPLEGFSAWVARIGNPLDGDWDVVYQIPFVHDGVRGIADFLVRVTDPDIRIECYEPVDAKLARKEAEPPSRFSGSDPRRDRQPGTGLATQTPRVSPAGSEHPASE